MLMWESHETLSPYSNINIYQKSKKQTPLLLHIHHILETVFNKNNFMLQFVDLEELEWRNKDKYLLKILLVACKKSITKKWLRREAPSVDEWIDIVHSIFAMEIITFTQKNTKVGVY